MADASPDSILRLIGNSEKGLAQIEMSLPAILKARLAVLEAIEKQDERNVVLELTLVILDSLLAENEVIYDISSLLNALLRATDDYTKRYYMQMLNLCFCEACQLFVGEKSDKNGLLSRLENLTRELNQAGCQLIAKHIIDDINAFKEEYTDKELRNITRHYDDPIKMYEKQRGLTNIDFFAKGASQLMAIRMELTAVSSFLLNLVSPIGDTPQRANLTPTKQRVDLKMMFNGAILKSFKQRNVKDIVQKLLSKGQNNLDECYCVYDNCRRITAFLDKRNLQIPDGFRSLELLILLRMEVLYLRYDIACSIWGYLNAASDMERSQNLRLIHITKQAALTHIYGYDETFRKKSLWTRIQSIKEVDNDNMNTDKVERLLQKLTESLTEDCYNSNIFAHYRYKQEFYIPTRLKAFEKMSHCKELTDTLKLLNVCKLLEEYTIRLLYCIDEVQKTTRKKQYDEWMTKFDCLADKISNNENSSELLNNMRTLISKLYYS